MSSEGFNKVDRTITILCFIPPESSIGYIFSTSCDNLTRSSLLFSSGSLLLKSTSLDSRSSDIIFPIFRIGFIAVMAYCGMVEIFLNLKLFIFFMSQTGNSSLSSFTLPPTNLIGGFKRIRLLPSVDFPQPDSPASPMISPSLTVNVAPSNALTSPLRV
ncbi:hypothetical protein ES705_44284 [subsurface metagenome]